MAVIALEHFALIFTKKQEPDKNRARTEIENSAFYSSVFIGDPAMSEIRFTDERLKKLKPETGKRRYVKDEEQPGLRLQITEKGVKTFQFQLWSPVHKKMLTRTLGKYGRGGIGIRTARDIAASLKADILAGVDIEQRAKDIRSQETFDDLFQSWLIDAKGRGKRTWETDERRYQLYIEKPLGNRPISWFTRDRIRRWHIGLLGSAGQRKNTKLGAHTPNRCLALVSTIFNTQLPDHPNPTAGVKPFKEHSRERFLQPDEMGRFFAALEDPVTPEYLRDFVYIALFTGARRGNVGAMRWSDVSLELKTWSIRPDSSKNQEPMVIPLDDEVLKILQRRKKAATSVFVFPAKSGKTGYLQAPRKSYASLKKRAGTADLTFHDLRRSMGSYMTMDGASGLIVAKGLGQKDRKSALPYQRFNLDPVRKHMSSAIEMMKAASELPDKVVDIKRGGSRK